MAPGKFIIAGNHTGNQNDVPLKSLQAIRDATHIFCDHLWVFKKDIEDFHKIDISNKYIKETGQIYDETAIANDALSILREGHNVVFITDTGLPGLADKGMLVTDIIYSHNILVEVIPGPTISGLAVAVAGLPSSAEQHYCISMFDYTKESKQVLLNKIKDLDCTIIVLCHPNEVKENLDLAIEALGPERWGAVCKNISMPSQEIIRGQLSDLQQKEMMLIDSYIALVFQGR